MAKSFTPILNDNELRVVWKVSGKAEGPLGPLVRFVLLTGARRTEAGAMTWDEVNANGDWTLPKSRNKTKVDLTRPLSQAARAVIEAQPRIEGCKFVFSSNGRAALSGLSKFKRRFDAAVLAKLREQDPGAAPLKHWVLDDLRTTSRALMSRAGVNADHAGLCLGNAVARVRDQHTHHAEMRAAYEKLAAEIGRIVTADLIRAGAE